MKKLLVVKMIVTMCIVLYSNIVSAEAFPNFTSVAEKSSKAVVNISGEVIPKATSKESNPIEALAEALSQSQKATRSLGSGFLISKDGLIVTNNHVIDGYDKIVVRLLNDDNEYVAKILGKDTKTDVALLQIDTSIVPEKEIMPLKLGNSDDAQIGEWVIAIGNQFQLGQTVTAGIISAKARRVPNVNAGPYDNFIQTDASINPGSSGGPLINQKGEVIGVNTAIFSPGTKSAMGSTGFNIGIGFATPINLVKKIVVQLKEHGRVTRGLLGVIIQKIDKDMADALNLKSINGALVGDVMPGSPAEKAKFQIKDVIIRYEGKVVKEQEDLPMMVADTPIGTIVDVVVLRDGKEVTLKAKIDELNDEAPIEEPKPSEKPNDIGTITQEITEEMARVLNLPNTKGVIVAGVAPNSAAEKAAIFRGDVIAEIGGKVVENKEDYEKIVSALPKDKAVLFLLKRADGTRLAALRK